MRGRFGWVQARNIRMQDAPASVAGAMPSWQSVLQVGCRDNASESLLHHTPSMSWMQAIWEDQPSAAGGCVHLSALLLFA